MNALNINSQTMAILLWERSPVGAITLTLEDQHARLWNTRDQFGF